MFYSWQRSQSGNQDPALLGMMFSELGCCGLGVPGSPPGPLRAAPPPRKGGTSKPSSSWLRDQPDPRHILWAGSCLRETLQDISALSWLYPSRKCHQRHPSVLLLNQSGAGLGLQERCGRPLPSPHTIPHTRTHTHAQAHTLVYIHTHGHAHARTHLYTRAHTHRHTHTHTHPCTHNTLIDKHLYTRTRLRSYTHL